MSNKTIRIIVDCILIILGIVFLALGIKDAYNFSKRNEIDDNVKFKRSYSNVPKDNIYKYVTLDEANDILFNKSGVILLGKTTDPWMQVLVKPLNDIVKEKLDVIYYLEMNDIKEEPLSDFDKPVIQTRLDDIALPYIYIVKDGTILTELGRDELFSKDYEGAPIEYFNDERIESLKQKIEKIAEIS